MGKKQLPAGVKAALITGCATIVAALIGFWAIHLRSQPPANAQSVANSPGALMAGRDIVVPHDDSSRSQYESVTIKTFDEKWQNMTRKRASAAVAVQEYFSRGKWDGVTNDTDGLDAVLGFFDTLGYDEEQGLVSTNAVYEYFCDDVLSYYQASSNHVAEIQKSDPTALPHLQPLYQTMRNVAADKPPKIMPQEIYFIQPELDKYFRSETNSVNLKDR
jgi:hypothetical protein